MHLSTQTHYMSQDKWVWSNDFIKWIDHHKDFLKLTCGALTLRHALWQFPPVQEKLKSMAHNFGLLFQQQLTLDTDFDFYSK